MEDRTVSDAGVMLGKPCIRGTRITVEHILEQMAAGRTIDDLLRAHGKLSREDIAAALEFAAESVRLERILPSTPAR